MQVYKDGIEKTIRESQLQAYKDRGYVEVSTKPEPQPVQKDIEVEDDFIVKAKPTNHKRQTKKRG